MMQDLDTRWTTSRPCLNYKCVINHIYPPSLPQQLVATSEVQRPTSFSASVWTSTFSKWEGNGVWMPFEIMSWLISTRYLDRMQSQDARRAP